MVLLVREYTPVMNLESVFSLRGKADALNQLWGLEVP